MSLFLEGVVSERNKIVIVGKGDNTVSIFLGHREQVLQDLHRSLSKLGIKLVEDEVWVLL